jgi:hypothetical protein
MLAIMTLKSILNRPDLPFLANIPVFKNQFMIILRSLVLDVAYQTRNKAIEAAKDAEIEKLRAQLAKVREERRPATKKRRVEPVDPRIS